MIQRLTGTLPEELKQHVGDIKSWPGTSLYAIRVHIKEACKTDSILERWKDTLDLEGYKYEPTGANRRIKIIGEPDPITDKRTS